MEKIIFHIDVNNAFLSWTAIYMLKNGSDVDIRNLATAIATASTDKREGIILAKSILAKTAGVKTGEAIHEAKRKCHNLKLYPPNFEWYSKCHKDFITILQKYSDKIEIFSIDEAFIEYVPLFGTYMEVAKKIQLEIYNSLGFTVNIGISTNKLLAKMASDFEKPNKIHTLFQEEVPQKMWPLPIRDLLFLGKATEKKLNSVGIKTIYDLAHANKDSLYYMLKSQGLMLYNYANGIDDSKIKTKEDSPKSISHSITTPRDLETFEEILPYILELSNKTASRLRADNLECKTITVTLRSNMFKNYTVSCSLPNYTDITSNIYSVAKELALKIYPNQNIRLIGVGLSNLSSSKIKQLSMWDAEENKKSKIEHTVDMLISKFGDKNIITRASCLKVNNDKNMR